MKDFVSKLSLYDILAMLIPGGMIFLFIALTLGNKWDIDKDKINPVLGWAIALVIAYLIGLVNHVITSVIWKPFRNCPMMIQRSYHAVINSFRYTVYLKRFRSNMSETISNVCAYRWIVLLVYIVILIASILMFVFCPCKSWAFLPLAIYAVLFIFYGIYSWHKKKCSNRDSDTTKGTLESYYQAYYYAATHRYGNDIFIIEGQVAFLQNMFLPLALFCVLPEYFYCGYLNNLCIVRGLAIMGILLLIPTVFYRQNTIYRRVWEDYEFLKRVNHEENTN